MIKSIRKTFCIYPETALKLKILSLATGKPMSVLLDILVNELWKQEETTITAKISSVKVSESLRRDLEQLKRAA